MNVLFSSLIFFSSFFIANFCKAQPSLSNEDISDSPVYDSILAKKTGADQYGMRTYYFAYLKVGPNRSQDSLQAAKLQRAHMDNIGRLANEGKLIVAGPFLDKGEVRGIYIFCVNSLEEAKALTETDPAVQAGRLVMDIHPWYGSAAMMLIPDLHKKVAKIEI